MAALIGSGSYEWPAGPWLRVNMVSSVDGAAQGPDGLSGSINTEADRDVFRELRAGADVILVGGGTARAEGYKPAEVPLVVVGHLLSPQLEGVASVRLVPGGDADELRALVAGLRAEGLGRILCEGGPTLLGGLLQAGVVDELCATVTPLLVGGGGKRIIDGPLLDGGVAVTLASLVERDGTLLARWLVQRS